MFDLQLADEQQALVDVVHSLAEDRLRPAARAAEGDGLIPEPIAKELHSIGVTAPVPESAGGQGVPDAVTYLLAAEELAWGDPGIAFAALASGHVALIVGRCGTPAQQRSLLAPFVERPARGSVALYEGFGRRPSEFTTTATPTATGWRIEGTKVAVANHGAADVALVVARRTDTGTLAAFVVSPGSDGINVDRDDHEHGSIALRAARTASISYDVDVDSGALVGAPSDDRLELTRVIDLIRLSNAAVALGCARAAIEYAAQYATGRIAFGKPISAFQGVAFMVADGEMDLDAARLEVWNAATSVESVATTDFAVSTCGEMVLRVTRTGLQVLGGHGFLCDHPMERWYRSALALAALDFDPLDVPVAFT